MALTIESVHQIDIGKSKTNNWNIENPLVSFSGGVFFIIARVANASTSTSNIPYWKVSKLNGETGFLIQYTNPNQKASSGELYIITVSGENFIKNGEVYVEVNENYLKKGSEFNEEPVRKTKIIVSG